MAKQREQIKDFSGGINSYDDARDLEKNEFTDIQNWLVNKKGQARTLKDIPTANSVANTLPTSHTASKIIPNYGLFGHGTDNKHGTIGTTQPDTGDYWIYKSDPAQMTIDAYSVEKAGWYDDRIDLYTGSGTKTDIAPAYYADEGIVRVSDSNFGDKSVNQYHGYIENKLFQSDDAGTSRHHIQRWKTGDQELKSFDDLGTTVRFWNYHYYNELPDISNLNGQNTIYLAYWLTSGGKFNGQYEFGLSPVYLGKQEGPISLVKTSAGITKRQMYNHFLHMQMYISTSSVSSLSPSSAHVLLDDRIMGINCYYRHYSQDVWYLLKYFDLQKGDKYHWGTYATSEKLHGKWIGDLTIGTLSNTTSYNYADVPITIYLNSGVGYGEGTLADRELTLRVDGAHTAPIYKEVTIAGINKTVNVNVKNPAAGSRNYKVYLLDETLSIIAEQDKDFTISDSGKAIPAIEPEDFPSAYDPYYDGG